MTSDQRFLKDNRIQPCDIRESNWREWRGEEIDNLRDVTVRQGKLINSLMADLGRWKMCAILGWLFAGMLFSIPIIERYGK